MQGTARYRSSSNAALGRVPEIAHDHANAVPPSARARRVRQLRPGLALDGAGHGAKTLWLATRGWRVTAVDFSLTAIGHARPRQSASGQTCPGASSGSRLTLRSSTRTDSPARVSGSGATAGLTDLSAEGGW